MFQTVRKSFHQMGIDSPFSFNFRNLFLLLALFQAVVTSFIYILLEAKSMPEYGIAFYSCVTALAAMTVFLIDIWKFSDFSKLFAKYEMFIEKSKRIVRR